MATAEYSRKWRAANPELNAAQRVRDLEKVKTPEGRAKFNAWAREHYRNPEYKAKAAANKARYLEKHGDRWYAQCRDRLLRKPWCSLLGKAKYRAKNSGLEYSLTLNWAQARWKGECELTGIKFIVGKGKTLAHSPSLDRIDSTKGYTQDNCRFVLWAINRFKSDGTDEEMIAIARALLERR